MLSKPSIIKMALQLEIKYHCSFFAFIFYVVVFWIVLSLRFAYRHEKRKCCFNSLIIKLVLFFRLIHINVIIKRVEFRRKIQRTKQRKKWKKAKKKNQIHCFKRTLLHVILFIKLTSFTSSKRRTKNEYKEREIFHVHLMIKLTKVEGECISVEIKTN